MNGKDFGNWLSRRKAKAMRDCRLQKETVQVIQDAFTQTAKSVRQASSISSSNFTSNKKKCIIMHCCKCEDYANISLDKTDEDNQFLYCGYFINKPQFHVSGVVNDVWNIHNVHISGSKD